MSHSVNELINHEAVCRTAPATPGLLIIILTTGELGISNSHEGLENMC